MDKTLGEIIDELIIANIKIWHYIDKQNDTSLSKEDRLKYADSVLRINKHRNELIKAIDGGGDIKAKDYFN